MKIKQLEYLESIHKSFLSQQPKTPRPDASTFLTKALVDGSPLKLRSVAEILESAREAIVASRYDRELRFSTIFRPPNSYYHALKGYEAEEKAISVKIAEYRKQAQPILDKARLETDDEAAEIAGALRELARKCGLAA